MSDAIRPTDEDLLEQARAGDQRALRRIMERYEGKVAGTIIGMLGPGPDADDVGQETFIRFYQAMDNFRGESNLGTYLTRIAINQALKTIHRRKTWRQRFFSRDDDSSPLDEPFEDGEEVVAEEDRRALVQRALQALSPEQRAVTVLRFMDGYSTKETAMILAVPEGTVMSRLSRAIDKLGDLLQPVVGQEFGKDEV